MKVKANSLVLNITRQGRSFSAMAFVELHSAGPDDDPCGWSIARAVAYTPAGETELTPSEIGLVIKGI